MKHVRLRLLVASAFTLLVAACSQLPTPQAQADTQLTPQFGSQNADRLAQVAVSKDLNAVFIAGNTYGSLQKKNAGSSDGYLRRYNRDGSLAWGVQFGSTDEDLVASLALDTHNRIYVAGDSRAHDTFAPQGFLKQYTADGRLAWSRNIETPGNYNYINGIATDSNDNIFVIGGGTTGGDYNDFSFIKKYSSRGSVVWSKIYNEQLFEAQTDQRGNLYTFRSVGDGIYQIAKFSRSGQFMWSKDIGKTANLNAFDLNVVRDAVYVAGVKYWLVADNYETDAYVAKFDLAGKLKWAKSFGTKVEDSASSVTADSRGNVYVVGDTVGALSGDKAEVIDVFVRKFSPSGEVIWTRQFGTAKGAVSPDIAALNSSELYIGGGTYSDFGAGFQGGGSDVFLTRLDSSGNRTWIR